MAAQLLAPCPRRIPTQEEHTTASERSTPRCYPQKHIEGCVRERNHQGLENRLIESRALGRRDLTHEEIIGMRSGRGLKTCRCSSIQSSDSTGAPHSLVTSPSLFAMSCRTCTCVPHLARGEPQAMQFMTRCWRGDPEASCNQVASSFRIRMTEGRSPAVPARADDTEQRQKDSTRTNLSGVILQ